MPITRWIRDLFGIHKDHIDKKKATLEVRRLENEERERNNLIKSATLDDVKKYDLKAQKLEYEHRQEIQRYKEALWRERDQRKKDVGKTAKKSGQGCLVTLLLILILVAGLLISVKQ